jgi:hypothetical protein
MLKLLSILLLPFSMVILTTCSKNTCENCYPTVFECKVDGKTWKTSCESKDIFGCTASDFKYYDYIPSMTLRGDNDNLNSSLELKVRNQRLNIGDNKLYIDEFIGTYFGDGNNQKGCEIYKLDTLFSHRFNIIELDTVRQIIKGNFHFTGKDKCGKTKKITEGKFDLIYGK